MDSAGRDRCLREVKNIAKGELRAERAIMGGVAAVKVAANKRDIRKTKGRASMESGVSKDSGGAGNTSRQIGALGKVER